MNWKLHIDRSAAVTLAILVLVSFVTIWVYLPGLSGPLMLDDLPQLDGLIEQGATDPATLVGNYVISTSGPTGRPVAMATFIADAMSHGPDIWWWKFNNLMFHLISGLLVFWLTVLLLQGLPKKTNIDPWVAGAILAGFWLLHPLQVSTVLYTVQRMTELSTLFTLAALVCYVKGRLVQDRSVGLGWLLIGVGFLLFYPLGVFSKENALVYPVYCSLIELFVLQFRGTAGLKKQVTIFHGVLLVTYVSAAVFVLLNFSNIVLESYATRDFTIGERVLTQFRVVAMYLSQLLLPVQQKMGFFHDDVAVSTGLFNPVTTVISALFLIALLTSAFLARRKLPVYAFGILFFFASHVVESSFLGLELMFEHRNYTGSFGILIACLAVATLATERLRTVAIVAVIAVSGLSLLTAVRAQTWSTPDLMYDYMFRVHPESPRLNLMYSNVYASGKNYTVARQLLAKGGSGIGPELNSLFLDCLEHGRVDDKSIAAIDGLGTSVIDGHATSSAEALVGEVTSGRCDASKHSLVKLLDEALEARSRAISDKRSLLYIKGRLLESMNDIDAAVGQYLDAQRLSNDDALSLYTAADALVRAGRLAAARDILRQASELERNTRIQRKESAQRIYLGLARIYEQREQFEEALQVYKEAQASMPKRSLFRDRMEELLLRQQRYDETDTNNRDGD